MRDDCLLSKPVKSLNSWVLHTTPSTQGSHLKSSSLGPIAHTGVDPLEKTWESLPLATLGRDQTVSISIVMGRYGDGMDKAQMLW